MSYLHEAAKMAITDTIERQAPVESVRFRPYTSWGFCMLVTARPSRYDALEDRLEALGLESNVKRIRQSATVWHYETVVMVPDDWQAPPSLRAAQSRLDQDA
jgi:hypothetical protein